ncbi:MAG: hypothetical protein ACFFAU_03855 [Candidatus Hodarchaeota archaeon]
MAEIKYSPGVCNIGEAEIRQRRLIGYLGLALTFIVIIIYIALVLALKLNPLFGVIVFIPAEMACIGLIQARTKFCAAYGLTHQQNVSAYFGVTKKIEDEVSRVEDRNKALKIILQSLLIAIIITVLAIFVGIIGIQISS